LVAPLKKRGRSEEKVKNDYDGDWTRLTDMLRASVACDSEAELRAAVGRLDAAKLARPMKDRFAAPLPNGYRDVLTNVRLPGGDDC